MKINSEFWKYDRCVTVFEKSVIYATVWKIEKVKTDSKTTNRIYYFLNVAE